VLLATRTGTIVAKMPAVGGEWHDLVYFTDLHKPPTHLARNKTANSLMNILCVVVDVLQCCKRSVLSFLQRCVRFFIELPLTFRQKLRDKHSRWMQLLDSISTCESSTKLMPYRLMTRRLGVCALILPIFITSYISSCSSSPSSNVPGHTPKTININYGNKNSNA